MTLSFHSYSFIKLVLIEIVLLSFLAFAEVPGNENGEKPPPIRRDITRTPGKMANTKENPKKTKDPRVFQNDDIRLGAKTRYSGKMYFAIAASSSGQIYSRAFNKTLANITQSYLTGKSNVVTYNISLETLVIELPETGSFSSLFLQSVCQRFEGKHVVAVLLVGNSRAAFTVALAAGHAGVPVLWARGTNIFLPGFNNLVSCNYISTSLWYFIYRLNLWI